MLPECATIPSMIDFEAIIRNLWPNAVKGLMLGHAYDMKAILALSREDDPNRRDTIRDWLQEYRVPQGSWDRNSERQNSRRRVKVG